MKTIFSTIALFSAVLFATSCTEDMEYKDSKVSSVNQLYEPTDGKEVVLQSSASASLFFEWAHNIPSLYLPNWFQAYSILRACFRYTNHSAW